MEIAMLRKRRIGRRPILDLKAQTLIPSEYQECKAFWGYAQRIPQLGKYLIKHANERIGHSWFTKALIAIGMRPGLLDYQWPVRNDKYIGLWLEFKRVDQREKKKDADQEEWIENLREIGHYASYAYGCEHAIKIYTDYVNNRL
jgi:hypothetical protein